MEKQTDTFWSGISDPIAIERRVAWRFGSKPGELTMSIASDQPISDLAQTSDGALEQIVLDGKKLKSSETVVPQLVFATVRKAHQGEQAVVANASGRELPILQVGHKAPAADPAMTAEQQMKATKTAIPSAIVGPGDHAVGFLVRLDAIDFYPLLAVSLPEEIASYKEGTGTTTDALNLLPFQG